MTKKYNIVIKFRKNMGGITDYSQTSCFLPYNGRTGGNIKVVSHYVISEKCLLTSRHAVILAVELMNARNARI